MKVLQQKYVCRTVNGLDTSAQRYSPYLSQAATNTGLFAIVKVPAKSVPRDFDGTRARLLPKPVMNPSVAPYATVAPSTLAHPPGPGFGPPASPAAYTDPGHCPPQMVQHPQGIPPPQVLSHPQSIQQPEGLGHPQPMAQTQGLIHSQVLAHLVSRTPPPANPWLHGGWRMPDSDAPSPRVSDHVGGCPTAQPAPGPEQHGRVMHQINQLCQPGAGIRTTSLCERQIPNPSPISGRLLINAGTQVSTYSVPTPMPLRVAIPRRIPMRPCSINLPTAISRVPIGYPRDLKPVAWNQHQLAHLQQIISEADRMPAPGLTGKHAAERKVAGRGFVGKVPAYLQELCLAQSLPLKPPMEKPIPSPPVNSLAALLAYPSGHYFQPPWNNILPIPTSDSSGSQHLTKVFHSGGEAHRTPLDCSAASQAGTGGGPVVSQNSLMQTVDYLSGDFQQACFWEQSLAMLSKAHEPDPTDSRSLHIQHQGID
uniref:Family with sequence similarity 222 member B n=1 Tax=Otolemur garnettii TaxID=30611 RepID=H0XLK8_OTOGA